jgi:hypothetical protein
VSTSKEREANGGRSIGSETCESRNQINAWRSTQPFPRLQALIHGKYLTASPGSRPFADALTKMRIFRK